MVDGFPDQGAAPDERPAGQRRLPLVAALLAGFVGLAAIGAVSGWLLAGGAGGDDEPDNRAEATASATAPTVSPTARSPQPRTPSPTRSAAGPALPPGQFPLPHLVGRDFEEVRAELRRLGLGWTLTFGAAGDDRSVAGTDPRGGTTVKRGTTVKVSVVGAAPAVDVPNVVDLPCVQGATRLIDVGLYPLYPTGKLGSVLRQDPEPSTELRWNGQVTLYCGRAGEQPSPSPGL